MCKLSLNQNLTISFADSSLPSTTTVNEYLQALVNKVFPKVLNLNNRSASEWTNTPGLSGSFTSFNPLTSVNYARGNYNNLIDYTNYNKIVYTVTKSDTSNLLILEPDGAFPNYTIQGSGTKSGEVDISGVTGLHRIAIQSTGGNVQFSKFQLE